MTLQRERNARWAATASVVTALTLLVAACSTNREVTRPEPLAVTDELLEGSLLTVDDLPGTWTEAEAQPIDAELAAGHECDDAVTALDADKSATATFTRDELELTNAAAWFPGQGRAAEKVYRDLLEECRSVVIDDEGLAIRAAELDFGVLSDDTLPIRIEIEPDSGTILERDLIVMRRGDLLHVVRLSGPRPSDKALLDSVVRTAIGRLGRLHQDTT